MAVGSFRLPITSTSGEWIRPADWLAMPTGITSANQTFVGLHAVFPTGQNYVAFSFTTSTGQYRVDWGDGTITLHNSNTIAQKDYDYAAISNSTLTSRGYKQSMITVTAVSGNLLTCNFQQRFVTSPVQASQYTTGFLDCILSMPNANTLTSIVFGPDSFNGVAHRLVERFDIKTIGNATQLIALFRLCSFLQSVPLFNTVNVISMSNMFVSCISLRTIPLFNTINVTNMTNMVQACISLITVPLFNTQNVTTMSGMFSSCDALQSVPLFNTIKVANVGQMFRSCDSLKEIPNFNLPVCTAYGYYLDGCSSITKIPLLNTSLNTDFTAMFNGCVSLKEIPALSTAAANFTTSFGTVFEFVNTSLTRCQMIIWNTVDFRGCQLSRTAFVEIFTNLVDRTSTTSANINITGSWGASALTGADRLIATSKNWTITG
jgi:hypothetical protein